jgi:hypothetical protein
MFLKRLIIIIGCIIAGANVTIAQTYGCTDARANNFNAGATVNDGSCTYNSTSYSPLKLIDKLSDTLNETSGLITINGELWSMGDNGNPNAIYHFDKTTGVILQSIYITNVINHDWEELTIDDKNIYIGDFGNNNGNRTNLAIYKISRSQITTKKVDSITAEIINFSYSDQVDFTSHANANRYDMEAMMVLNDTLHLFSKDWVDGHTRHFILSTTPGTYSIAPIDSIDAGCMITGAAFDPQSKRIVLTGYNKTGFCYLWLLWDFTGNKLFSGNKRKIDLGFFTNTGQIEGVCFNDSNNVYITNEKNLVNNKLCAANVGQWMNSKSSSGIDYRKQNISALKVYPNPAPGEIMLTYTLQKPASVSYCIYNTESKLVYCTRVKSGGGNVEQKINIASLRNGTYYLLVHSDKANTEKIVFIKQ